jgi:RNA polymerase sigma-70 factor (ECF subfamily)
MSWGTALLVENTWTSWRMAQEIGLQSPEGSSSALPPTVDSSADARAERELLEGCRNGRMAAFEQLFLMQGPRMKSLALNLLGNVADAEDVVQETFLKVYRSIGSFKGESALATWVFRILINNCYDLRRRKQRRGGDQPELELGAEGTPDPAVPASDHPLRVALERAVARLRPRLRDVFLLAEVEGFKHQEIGRMLGISEANSKNLLFQAKRELREILKAHPSVAR